MQLLELIIAAKSILDAPKVKSPPASLASTPSAPATSVRGPRTPRTPRRLEAQPTRLEALDDGLGPLGPLGENVIAPEPAPAPPSKEQSVPTRNTRQGLTIADSRMSGSMMESVDLNDNTEHQSGRARQPPPVQPPPTGIENTKRQGQPSVSVERAAKPTFDITVGDPHKVGDLTSSHIVYQVRTKVRKSPSLHFLPTLIRQDYVESLQAARICG